MSPGVSPKVALALSLVSAKPQAQRASQNPRAGGVLSNVLVWLAGRRRRFFPPSPPCVLSLRVLLALAKAECASKATSACQGGMRQGLVNGGSQASLACVATPWHLLVYWPILWPSMKCELGLQQGFQKVKG